ncbi:glucokinase [Tahibacter amnicola]|uniref:Glucokinase n=1 Tax=Tahibacter amnicola TaxID=2976241 RepID=A0ABY6BHJ2_9GAMM|nr:glucokinase [Tahibacter amnicola]UXI68977.1 glucokinase [Tahibacter amnicola]
MAPSASPRIADVSAAKSVPFLAADVGGTHARVGLVRPAAAGASAVTVEQYDKYVCADYPNLGVLLRQFLQSAGGVAVDRVAIACAGVAVGDCLVNTNLPWAVSVSEIRAELGVAAVELVNDFEAVAYATHYLRASESVLLPGNAEAAANGPTLIVGPGTGLGAAVRIPGTRHPTVLATEAGQAALAPGNELEVEILRVLMRQSSHVSNETVLSGPGLVNLYNALCDIRGAAGELRAPTAITEAALAAQDPLALETLNVFCAWLGGVVGDLALLTGARGGVHLAGGILPHIRQFLLHSSFSARFLAKGAMRTVLERIPVGLIDHGQLGVVGAAAWMLDTHQRLAAPD